MVEIYHISKEGVPIAKGKRINILDLPFNLKCPKLEWVTCLYFSVLNLEHRITCNILSGSALNKYLDKCTLSQFIDGEKCIEIDDLRYVHGRAEVAKGFPRVTTVLLAIPISKGDMTESIWFGYLPTVYYSYLQFA
jgi:hypothetical protein